MQNLAAPVATALASSVQAPDAVLMVRPHRFHPNPQTAADNGFQRSAPEADATLLAARAHAEVGLAAQTLMQQGVRVHLFEDTGEQDTPDSVFPNNWISTHADGRVALYPMHAPNRRRERRSDVLALLEQRYRLQQIVDYTRLEQQGLALEGTGAMVLDHAARIAYLARSRRAAPRVLALFCRQFGYRALAFDTADRQGRPVYHTNVLMCVATEFALVGLELISSVAERAQVQAELEASGRRVIALSEAQIGEFAGNAIELGTPDGRILALSERAAASLSAEQTTLIERSARLVPLRVPTIELAGGSVRCMIAGIHLPAR